MSLTLITTHADLKNLPARTVFVPTMGALHEGHAALIRSAAKLATPLGLKVSVSIFVNPTQFNDPADFARYPKTLEADLALCESAGAHVIFAPELQVMYPSGEVIAVPALPAVATEPKLEDGFRPGHFAGVCQVVKRLFDLVRPSHAIFGEKDWQQLQAIKAMTASLNLPVQIINAPTIREPDGLALSSRNRFLSQEDRGKALALSRALAAACKSPTPALAEAELLSILQRAGIQPEYAVVRHAETLLSPQAGAPTRALIAARVGTVRLIDNCAWPA